MTKDCYRILEKRTLIQLLQSEDQTAESSVYGCLQTVFRQRLLAALVRVNGSLPGGNARTMIAEEAFQDAFFALVKNVRTGIFTEQGEGKISSGTIGYFHGILWNKFQNKLKRKQNKPHAMLLEDRHGGRFEMSADFPAFNREGGISIVLRNAIMKLKEKCKIYMHWQYMEGMSTEDIISRSDNTSDTVRKDLSICRASLLKQIKTDCGLNDL